MTDDPPAGVSVLFFQISLTDASLIPSSSSGSAVSLLPNSTPIQIDVTKLQALAAFLSTASAPAGTTYSSLSLTFANPQLVILNNSDTSLGSSCAVGSVCQLTPAIDSSATVTFTSAPFPVTISQGSPLGFLVDFHLNTIIQSDLSVNLGVSNGITLAQLPSTPAVPPAAPPFGFLTGTVETVNTSQDRFTLQTSWGKTFTVDIDSNTAVAPALPCPSPGFIACLHTGDTVQVQVASVESDGDLLAASVTLLLSNSSNRQLVEGTVVGYSATQIKLLIHGAFASPAALPVGGIATVTLDQGAAFSVDSGSFTIPSGLVFSGVDNLWNGQELQVAVDSGSLSCASPQIVVNGWGPPSYCTFSTNAVQLEPSQITGNIASISSPSFTLDYEWSPCTPPGGGAPVCNVVGMIQYGVETTSQTTYQGFTPDSFSGLATNDFVSVNGWIFEADNGLLDPALAPPVILAQTVTNHPAAAF